MKIGLISDSHDHADNVRAAIAAFKDEGVEVVIHAGDVVSPPIIGLFKDSGMELHGVYGNNDGEKLGLEKLYQLVDGELHGDFAELESDGLRLGVYHGTSDPLLTAVIASGLYDVVVSGHTHLAVNRTEGKTLVLNPGSAHGFDQDPTVMVLDSATRNVTSIRLDQRPQQTD